MSLFSQTINAFWQEQFLGGATVSRNDQFSIIAKAKLDSTKRVMVLRKADGVVHAVLTPELLDRLGLLGSQVLTETLLREKNAAGQYPAAQR